MSETIGQAVVDGTPYPIDLDREAGDILVRVGDAVGFEELEVEGSVLTLIHSEVDPPLNGKGVAAAIARAALDYARAHHMTVKPVCPFVAAYIKRHPEYQDLVDASFPWKRG